MHLISSLLPPTALCPLRKPSTPSTKSSRSFLHFRFLPHFSVSNSPASLPPCVLWGHSRCHLLPGAGAGHGFSETATEALMVTLRASLWVLAPPPTELVGELVSLPILAKVKMGGGLFPLMLLAHSYPVWNPHCSFLHLLYQLPSTLLSLFASSYSTDGDCLPALLTGSATPPQLAMGVHLSRKSFNQPWCRPFAQEAL